MRASCLTFVLVVATTACGDDRGSTPGDQPDVDAAAPDPAPSLFIDGELTTVPMIPDARLPTDVALDVHVRVLVDGEPLTTGEVVLDSDAGPLVLTYDPDDREGRWRGVQPGYVERYTLRVAGGGVTHALAIDGPDHHFFKLPLFGFTVDPSWPVEVVWSKQEIADRALISTRAMAPRSIDDRRGRWMIPVGDLTAYPHDKARDEIRVTRSVHLVPADLAPGSIVHVTVDNRLPVVVGELAP
ncbi:MAG TPA: hypothetical protein VM734_24515 [Kofleriaceae bacterium]|nr:hypothetical protein [Kofleriaceae bacterium]